MKTHTFVERVTVNYPDLRNPLLEDKEIEDKSIMWIGTEQQQNSL